MKRNLCMIAALAGPLTAAIWTPQQHAQAVGKMFQARCASCHLPPDPVFKSDQAWIGQIQETA